MFSTSENGFFRTFREIACLRQTSEFVSEMVNAIDRMLTNCMIDFLFPVASTICELDWNAAEPQLTVHIRFTTTSSNCPDCQTVSTRVHSTYVRRPRDLACFGNAVALQLEVRRFFCDSDACQRRTFADSFEGFIARYARRTDRLRNTHLAVAFECSGEAGRRIFTALGMPVSGDTLIRDIRAAPEAACDKPIVLGIDDWAIRKGITYGTILVDLETHQPVDVLDGRDTETVTRWLEKHPQIQTVSRDRSREYTKAITQALPNAEQVADRWHLLANLTKAVNDLLITKPVCLKAAAAPDVPATEGRDLLEQGSHSENSAETSTNGQQNAEKQAATTKADRLQQAAQSRKQERFEQVQALYAGGHSKRAIAKTLNMSTRTVRKYIEAKTCPTYTTGFVRPSKLRPHITWLETEWQAGCTNATELWRRLCAERQFTGSRGLVSRWATQQRKLLPQSVRYARQQQAAITPKVIRQIRPPAWSASATTWLLMRDEDTLDEEEKQALQRVRAADSQVEAVWQLAQQFAEMLRKRQHERLETWIEQVVNDNVTGLVRFAKGLVGDLKAVRNALKLHWSNGQTEGQVNRLKFIKRQMYGRANFDLLRKRVLYQPASA